MEQFFHEKNAYQSPRMELLCVDLCELLLTDVSIDGNSLDSGDTKDLEEEEYQGYLHAGVKQRGIWDDSDAR